ncbi:MAG TPA: hypoxanthine phosphoribosyltransferase [Acidimicrobiales bacterium]|nr:hypoxanthine phosphoribosyltransferase [Acidimicrobiales bacterium]
MSARATPLLGPEELAEGVARLGRELSEAYPRGVLLVAVLKGGVWFLADLVRAVGVPCSVDFLAISSYAEGTGRVRIVKDLDLDIFGRDVVLVEDIVDTGLTLNYLLGELGRRQPRSLEVCALLDKRARRLVPTPCRFRGFEIGDEFVVGYGLDYGERYRNLDQVVAADLAVLRADPDAYVSQLYGG